MSNKYNEVKAVFYKNVSRRANNRGEFCNCI